MYSISWHVIGVLRKRIWFKNNQKKRVYRPTNICSLCFCLWLKATVSLERDNSTIATFRRPGSSYVILHHAKFHSHWCINAVSTNRACPVFGSVNDTKQKQTKAHTFNCTGLQVCLKITLHTYAQVQDSRCIAHLWQNWVLAVKTNGHVSNEVPNYLIFKK